MCIVGGQLTIPAMASVLFPAEMRASGIGCVMAIGRAGSIIGPLVGGALIAQHVPFDSLFMMAALLALCGSAGIAISARTRPAKH
jgi:MFS transporter, AAHS family, 4-hydroxybenzoate transporter